MRKYDLAIFDLDGVLTETSVQHYIAWKSLADELGIEFDLDYNEKLKGVSRLESLELILIKGNMEKAFSSEEKNKLATKKNNLYIALIEDFTRKDLFPGVIVLFEMLIDLGIKIALASASNNAKKLLENMAIAQYFDLIVDPSQLKQGKPSPEIFLKAASTLAIDPKRCIGFEDAVAGISAIKGAGMYAVGIGDPEVLCEADIVYPQIQKVELGLFSN